MAQQVFNQWVPVAKAQNEQGQEVYLPFAGIHAQTRDGKDEVFVGAGNMVWTGSMWVPVSAQNRLPVEATLTGHSVPMRYLVIDYGDVEVAGRYNIFGSSFSFTQSGSQRDSRSMLDVSLYRKVMIRIENKSDNAVSVGSIYFGSEPDSVFGDSVKSISLSDIPALATVWLTPWEGDDVVYMPELASGFPSLGMWAWPASSLQGTVNVKVWGWN